MRILIVAMPDSIHTARWISQIADQGWDIHLFPSIDCGVVHPEIRNLTVHCAIFPRQGHHPSVKVSGIPLFRVVRFWAQKFKYKFFYKDRVAQLKRLITKLNPDIIHTMEIQHAGYLTMEAKDKMPEKFPSWIVTNWGSDIYLFGRLAEHEQKIRAVLHSCDFYSCECKRDVCLAKAYGFGGTVLPVFPNTGGFDMARVSRLRQQGPISTRRLIVLKGYQHWSGRALVGLRALERCADLLAGYELAIYCATPDVVIAAELFSRSTGMPVSIIPFGSSHDEILEYHGKARVSIGLSISDAISTSLLEAMVMGAFPIQSWTACADEWIDNGTTGILVHPEDPDMIELAIRRALTHDDLVNNAAEANAKLAAEKLNMATLKASAIDLYRSAFTKKAKNQGNPRH